MQDQGNVKCIYFFKGITIIQFLKSAIPGGIHVTEMKFIPQIRYMTIHKLLELQKCTPSVTMRFQYDVKPPCTAVRASKHCGMDLKRAWICSWGILLHTVSMLVQSIKEGCWKTMMNNLRLAISQTCSMGNISGERASQRSGDTCCSSQKACTCDWVLLKYGMWCCLKEG